jgi:hypothetical protein
MTQRCFNTIVLFSILFVSRYSQAQMELFPFEDYQHCTTGFRNNNYPLDTVYQAKFENAIEITYPFQSRWGYQQGLKFWIFSDNGKYGCLCSNGEWVLNCLYDTLSFDSASDQFIAKLSGKVGTLKKPLQQVFPFEYDEIYTDQTYIDAESFYYSYHSYDEFYVRKNKLLGVYTFDGKEIIRPQYDSIQAIGWSVRLINPMEKEFYLVTKNGLKGLLAQNGKVILEPQYQKVQSFYESQKVKNTILFRITDTLGLNAVFDEFGKQLTPFSEFNYFGAITEWTNQQFKAAGFAIERGSKAKKERMTNLTTGKSSGWYARTRLVGDWVWAQSKKEWLVLDSNFDTLFRQTDPNDRLFYFDYSAELKAAEYVQNATEPNLPEVTYDDYSSIDYSIPELFVLKHFTPQTKKERKNRDEIKNQYALLNASSGKMSPVFYDKIIRLGDKGVYYYWCFQLYEDSVSYPVDIYDGTGKLLKSLNVELRLEEFISKRYNARNFTDRSYPFFSFQQSNGKHTVYGIDGWQPDPEFDDEVSEIRKWEDSTGYFRFTDSANHFYYADLNGKPLLSGRHFFYGGSGYYSDNREKWVVPMKANGVYSYINEHLEELFDSCQEIKGLQYHSIPRLEPTPKTFAIRNGYVYVVLKDSFLLVDAKLFLKPNGMNKIGNDFYVNDEGKMFTEDEVRIYRNLEYKNTGNLLLRVKNNQLTLRKLKDSDDNVGTLLRIIPDVYDYEISYNALKVITTDKKEGYIDNENGEWLLKPVYEHTRCMDRDDKMIRFAQSNQSEDKHWFIINKEGEPLTKPIFDEPFYFDYFQQEWTYADSDGKTGLVNHQFEWVTKPEYYDREHRYAIFLLANDHYAIVDYQTGKSFRAPQDSVAIVLEKRFFWFNDSIQILDSDGTELLAPIPASEAKVSKSLRNLLDPGSVYAVPEYADSTYAAYGFIYCPESNHFFTQLSNECILENAKHDLQIFVQYDGRYVYNYSMYSRCKREPLFATEHFFSERVTGDCYEQPELYESYNQDFSFRNYSIINNQLARVYCVGDLLKHGPEYEDRLNKLLETLIQSNQIFGIACTNMPAAIEELKRNFYIENGDFHFLYYELGEHEGLITLAFDEIKDLLREPEVFK